MGMIPKTWDGSCAEEEAGHGYTILFGSGHFTGANNPC
jgi:hypothetical protein